MSTVTIVEVLPVLERRLSRLHRDLGQCRIALAASNVNGLEHIDQMRMICAKLKALPMRDHVVMAQIDIEIAYTYVRKYTHFAHSHNTTLLFP